jgi:hypothetical protein
MARPERVTPSVLRLWPIDVGRISCVALMISGVAGVVIPERVGAALDLPATSSRGVAETRAALGGTYAALGGWALLSRAPAARVAVGVTWLGAGVARLGSLVLDHPETDWTFWAYLAAEIGLGVVAIGSSVSRSTHVQRNNAAAN